MNRQPLHLLLVEDNEAHARIVTKGFRAAGNHGTMDRVADGKEAIDYVRRHGKYRDRPRPDVILLDLKLPRLDGHGVLSTLKSDERLKLIPVVVLTTSDADCDIAEAYRLHANSYLVKPVGYIKFRDLICAVTSYWGAWNRPPGAVDAGFSA